MNPKNFCFVVQFCGTNQEDMVIIDDINCADKLEEDE